MNAQLPSSLDPAFAGVMTLAERIAVGSIADPEFQDYLKQLKKFDWQFEFSDDFGAYRAGKDKLAKLHEMQRRVDPNGSAWLLHLERIGNPHGAPGPRVGVFA